ncbi:MAG: 50S ribosomal protein L17 [Bacteroidia bacterium]
MRHGKTINHLGRMAAHRDALLQNLAVSLIMNKRINTTVAKAKALRRFVEPIITRSKDDSMHNRRTAFTYLQDKHAVKELFATVGDKVANRPGGYTRIIRTGFRLGDAAEMCMIELVDFNELMLADAQTKKAKTRRSRSGRKSSDSPISNESKSSSASGIAGAATVLSGAQLDAEDTQFGSSTDSATDASTDVSPASSSDTSPDALTDSSTDASTDVSPASSSDASTEASTASSSDASTDASAE